MTRFEETYAEDCNFHMTTQQEERSDASSTSTWQDGSRFSNPKSAVLSGSSEIGTRHSNGIVQEVMVSSAESRNKTGSRSIGIPKTKVSFPKSSKVQNDSSESRKGGAHGMGIKQPASEKGRRRSSPVRPSRSPNLKTQFQDSPPQWKALSSGVSKGAACNLPSIGSMGEGLSECSHSWPGPGSSLLGSPYGSPGGPTVELPSAAQPVVGTGRYSVQPKMFSEHWSLEEVNQAIEVCYFCMLELISA